MSAPRPWMERIEGFLDFMASRGWTCGWIVFGQRACPIGLRGQPIAFGPFHGMPLPSNDNRRGRR